jgi:uncharacterized protein
VNGEAIFKALLEAGMPDLVRRLTAADQGQLVLAVMGKKYRALPPKVREALEKVARMLESETT